MCLIGEDPESGTIDKPVRTGYKNVEIMLCHFLTMPEFYDEILRDYWLSFCSPEEPCIDDV